MGIIDDLKAAANLAHDVKNIPLYEKLMGLMTQVYEVHDENRTLREQVRELRKQLELRDSLRFEDNFYWLDKDGKQYGPYCPSCYDGECAIRRMMAMTGNIYGCSACGLLLWDSGAPVDDPHMRNRLGATLPGYMKQFKGGSR